MINNQSYVRAQQQYDNQTPFEPCRMKECPECNGEGEILNDGASHYTWMECPVCKGDCEIPMTFDDLHEQEENDAYDKAKDHALFDS